MTTTSLDRNLVTLHAPSSFAAEQYQGLRLTLERLKRARDVRVVAVSSPAAGDGKTLTSINLAGALARGSDARVLLVDADLRCPKVGPRLGLADGIPGLANAVSDETVSLTSVVQTIDPYGLDVVPAGVVHGSVNQLVRSARLETLIKEARDHYDFVVLDTPPVLPVFDAAILSRMVDGLLVVVSANQTPRKLLAEALNLLDASKVIGLVFNNDDRPMFGYYHGYYKQYFPGTSNVAQEA